MSKSRLLSLAFVLSSATLSSAAPRPWKSADGVRTIQGEYVSRTADSVTIRTTAGERLVLTFSQLHPDERTWLNANHAVGPAAASGDPIPDSSAVFDTLQFGDTRDETLAKLKASKIVEMTTEEAFLGRSGMNGVFKTRQKIGSLNGFLYFDWNQDGGLKELTLQTAAIPSANYQSEFEPSWKEFVNLITTLYGKPVQRGPMPSLQSIPDGSLLPSHLWTLENGTSILLGTARDGDKYQLVVRFSQKKVKAVEIP